MVLNLEKEAIRMKINIKKVKVLSVNHQTIPICPNGQSIKDVDPLVFLALLLMKLVLNLMQPDALRALDPPLLVDLKSENADTLTTTSS